MKRSQLKELLRQAIYETSKETKVKRKATGFDSATVKKHANVSTRATSASGRTKPGGALDYIRARDQFSAIPTGKARTTSDPLALRPQQASLAIDPDDPRDRQKGGAAWQQGLKKVIQRKSSDAPGSLAYTGTNPDGTMKPTVVPPQVQQAASKAAGGRVLFGRYYDAQGNYLGRSQGGKWVDASSDPNAKTQMEVYQKLMEIESGHYSSKDKEMVKEMIREVMKSCK
jgi:hypothetical protein